VSLPGFRCSEDLSWWYIHGRDEGPLPFLRMLPTDDDSGLINSFGVFQDYYPTILAGTSESAISWIGSIQAFLLMFVGILCGRLLDAGYLHTQLCIGIFLEGFGMAMASFSTQYWQLFLTQGVCVGLGAGFLYLPSVVVATQYFSSRVMLATGIVATGSSIGKSPSRLFEAA
jgi:MFS family permease